MRYMETLVVYFKNHERHVIFYFYLFFIYFLFIIIVIIVISIIIVNAKLLVLNYLERISNTKFYSSTKQHLG
jgi:hypothetical protein